MTTLLAPTITVTISSPDVGEAAYVPDPADAGTFIPGSLTA